MIIFLLLDTVNSIQIRISKEIKENKKINWIAFKLEMLAIYNNQWLLSTFIDWFYSSENNWKSEVRQKIINVFQILLNSI